MGIAGVPGATAVLAQEPPADPETPTTTTPAPDPAPGASPSPAPDPPASPSPAPPPAPPPASRLYTPPVGGPLDFARETLPAFDVPEERRRERVPAPPRETTPGRVSESRAADGSDDEEQARAAAAAEATGAGAMGSPLALPATPAQIPNFFIGHFAIPPFLLSIYQAAGIQYGVPWEVLAAINEIETDYGRNLNVSSAGATGWMQFMPSSWQTYGVDANEDGRKDPYNPVDAIFAAARYLKAAGAEEDLRKAIFAYNHAAWYVDSVLARARFVAGLPTDLVGSLTGLTQGRSPIAARMTYTHRAATAPARRELRIDAPSGAAVVAVQDGRIMRVGRNDRLGRFVMLRDAYGNTYTYGHLGTLARNVLVAKEQPPARSRPVAPLAAPAVDPVPLAPASEGSNRADRTASAGAGKGEAAARAVAASDRHQGG